LGLFSSDDFKKELGYFKTMADKEYLKSLIRRALIRDPNISVRALADTLGIDKNTALKYRKEVVEENKKELENEIRRIQKISLEEEIANWEIELKELIRELWMIISSGESSKRDRVNAIKTLIESKKQLFDLKFDAGLFIKKVNPLIQTNTQVNFFGEMSENERQRALELVRIIRKSVRGKNKNSEK